MVSQTPNPWRRVALDVAASEASSAFRYGRLLQRATHAPLLRCACIIDEASNAARTFSLQQYAELWVALREAEEVVTWNGNHHALLVLRKLYGAAHFPIVKDSVQLAWGEHIDICDVIESERRLTHRVSLTKAIALTFGEHVKISRPAGRLRQAERANRCESAARLTLRLWQAYRFGDGLALNGRTIFHTHNPHRS